MDLAAVQNEILEQIKNLRSWDSALDYHEKMGFQQKNPTQSLQVRREGNKLYTQKNHDDKLHQAVLCLYTKSAALAMENSEEQALSYGNRSALLMHLKKYKECLTDITRAYSITQSPDLKKKLLMRKEKCIALIKDKDEKVENLNDSQKPLTPCTQDIKLSSTSISNGAVKDKMQLPKVKTLYDLQENLNKLDLPKIMSPNKIIPNFADSISLEYNEKFGRHVVATRDIKPGEILVVEKGFVFPAVNKIYLVCSHCLNFSWNGIPCPSCVFAIYCSEECKIKAWQEYHDIECCILPPLFSGAFQFQYLSSELSSLRLLITIIKKESLQSVFDQSIYIQTEKDLQINGFLTDGKFDNTNSRAYFNLISHMDKVQHDKYNEFGVVSAVLLSKYTMILKDYKDKHYQTLFHIMILITKLTHILGKNAYTFQDFGCKCGDERHLNCIQTLGLISAPCSSLFNHSCYENISRIFCKDGNIVLFSTQPIKKNEQLFSNYGLGLDIEKKERQKYLKNNFNFTCTCEACENDWNMDPVKLDQLDDTILMKIQKDFSEFKKKAELQKVKTDCIPLAYSIKMIELGHKYFGNNFDACMFGDKYLSIMCIFMRKLYGVEIDIPKIC